MSTINTRKGQKGGRAKLTQAISEKAVYGLRAESQTYEDKYSKKQVAEIVKRYATIANKRLAAIEDKRLQGSSPAYKHVERASYSGFSYTTEKNRFKTSSKQTYSELVEELYQLHQFLFKAKTSTIAQIREVNRKRLDMTNKWLNEQGLDDLSEYDPEEAARKLGEFFRDANIKAFSDAFGSDSVVKAVEDMYGDFSEESQARFKETLDNFLYEARKMGEIGSKWLNLESVPYSDLMSSLKDFQKGKLSWT